jgi:uncharacterized protein CbrC (UPF0167 family)
MIKKTINCPSCETRSDIIIRHTNLPDDEVEVTYCPVCSSEVSDFDNYSLSDGWDE